jgi:hypothetical protein
MLDVILSLQFLTSYSLFMAFTASSSPPAAAITRARGLSPRGWTPRPPTVLWIPSLNSLNIYGAVIFGDILHYCLTGPHTQQYHFTQYPGAIENSGGSTPLLKRVVVSAFEVEMLACVEAVVQRMVVTKTEYLVHAVICQSIAWHEFRLDNCPGIHQIADSLLSVVKDCKLHKSLQAWKLQLDLRSVVLEGG